MREEWNSGGWVKDFLRLLSQRSSKEGPSTVLKTIFPTVLHRRIICMRYVICGSHRECLVSPFRVQGSCFYVSFQRFQMSLFSYEFLRKYVCFGLGLYLFVLSRFVKEGNPVLRVVWVGFRSCGQLRGGHLVDGKVPNSQRRRGDSEIP